MELATSITTTLILLALSLGVFLITSLSPYRAVIKVVGRPFLTLLIGAGALFALLFHIAPHFAEFVEETFTVTGPLTYVWAGLPFLMIAGLGFYVEALYHSHEHDVEHREHIPEIPAWGSLSGIIRMIVLATHAFLDGHIMASVGLGWMAIPFIFHKGVDGLVVNGERTTHAHVSSWKIRIAVQLLATTGGAFLYLEALPELVHVGLVAAVIGLYSGALRDYVRQYKLFLKYHPEMIEAADPA